MYLDILDPETRSRGLALSSWGANEVAWDKHTVRQVIAAAANAGLPILGGDVWRADASGPVAADGRELVLGATSR